MKKRYSAEQIVGKLRQADVELGKGKTTKLWGTGTYCYRRLIHASFSLRLSIPFSRKSCTTIRA